MNKIKIFPAFILIILFGTHVNAQSSTSKTSHEEIRKLLSMSATEYDSFCKGTKKYDLQLDSIMRDSSLQYREKTLRMEPVLTARREFVKGYLSEDQLQKLLEFEKQRATAKGSKYYEQKQASTERLKQRRIKIITEDSSQKLNKAAP